MSYCINPTCSQPNNQDNQIFCQTCGSELLLSGQYRVVKKLGGGGFGITYEVDKKGTAFVLKVLSVNAPVAKRLFKKEAEVLKQLNHPGIPKV